MNDIISVKIDKNSAKAIYKILCMVAIENNSATGQVSNAIREVAGITVSDLDEIARQFSKVAG